jgi:hypothetical protein
MSVDKFGNSNEISEEITNFIFKRINNLSTELTTLIGKIVNEINKLMQPDGADNYISLLLGNKTNKINYE